MLMIDDVQMTLICLGGFALKCGKALFIVVQYSLRSRSLEIGSLRYGDYGLRLRMNMLLRMIKTT